MKSTVKRLPGSDHVIWAPMHEIANGVCKIGNEVYSFFRSLNAGNDRGAICLSVPASRLSRQEILAINKICDKEEGMKNRAVKITIAQALCEHFNNVAIELYDIGCGSNPLANNIPANAQVDYTGIDIDPANIEGLREKGLRAYDDWEEAIEGRGSTDKPRVATSVYALHLLKAEDIGNLANFINDKGFFVGNLYKDKRERIAGEQRHLLEKTLIEEGLEFSVMDDNNSNEYWIIHTPQAENEARKFISKLERSIKRNRPQELRR